MRIPSWVEGYLAYIWLSMKLIRKAKEGCAPARGANEPPMGILSWVEKYLASIWLSIKPLARSSRVVHQHRGIMSLLC